MSVAPGGEGRGRGEGRHYLLHGVVVVGAIFAKPLESVLHLLVVAPVHFQLLFEVIERVHHAGLSVSLICF